MPRTLLTIATMITLCCCLAAGTVDTVRERGYLKCGVSTGLPGFSHMDAQGKWQGFDVDFCRAAAAAIFDNPDKVEFTPLTSKTRFTALQSGEIDVLIRNTTWNLSRSASLGLSFAAVNFYDGQAFMVPKSMNVHHVYDLDGASICMVQGTTTEMTTQQYFEKRSLDFRPVYFEKADQMIMSYQAGRCDAMTGDASAMIALQNIMQAPEEQIILAERISKEPLAIMVRDDDPEWIKLHRWTLWATLTAEELQVDQENIDERLANADARTTTLFFIDEISARNLGVGRDFAVNIIRNVGNYSDIFERHFGKQTPFDLPRGQNALWLNGGLMYAAPFN